MKPNSTAAAACTHTEVSKRVGESDRQQLGRTRADETGRGGDGDQAGDGARAEADSRPLALETVVPEHPGETTHARSQVGDDARLDGAEVRGEGGAAVEPEPPEPEEDRAEDDIGRVVGLVRETLGTVPATLA